MRKTYIISFTCLLLLLLLLLVLHVTVTNSLNPTLDDDVLGLIVFKADLVDPYGKLSSWNEDDDSPCNWTGVRCNPRSNRVSEVVLDGFGLSGKMGRGLMQLKLLRKLSLARNNISGSVGVSVGELSSLRIIDLSENGFSGVIPDGVFDECGASLRSVSLARNGFSGRIPDGLVSCSSLGVVNFSGNGFSGVVPSGVWSLNGLRVFDVSDNRLEGEIPKEVEGLFNLREINLSRNKFTGSVPEEIGACLLLRAVDFSENSFTGRLPTALQKLSLCNELNFRGNLLTGEVPEWIGELGRLETVDFSKNMLSGAVPDALGNIKSLKILDISDNGFTGSLPASIVNCKNIQILDASRNSLTGFVPTWVFQLGLQTVRFAENKLTGSVNDVVTSASGVSHQNLQVLDVSHNELTGQIPSDIEKFCSLRLLNMSGNSLTGEIPEAVGKLHALTSLDLSENRLNGSIPSSVGACSSLTSMILSLNNLSGQVPATMSKLAALEYADLSFNKLNGTLPKPLANLVHLKTFNVSHNQLQGELPAGAFFNTISPYSVSNNPSLCGAAVNQSCAVVLPKPIVLNPNSPGSDPDSVPQTITHKKILLSVSALVAIGAAAVIVIGIIFITVLNIRVRSTMSRSAAGVALSAGYFSSSHTTDTNSGKLVMFSGEPDFSTGAHALLNKDCELGRGGFGTVYRTVLGDGRSVAIKKLTVSSLVKSQEDFEREVKKLGKIHHQNLVPLEGYYWTPSLQLLIYEYVSGGNVYKHLHETEGSLTWNERFNIIIGIAKSLAHLHTLGIIHYNLKSSNVLIDGLGEPKVADFGLARLLPMLDRYVLSSKIQSALGYMAPEFACKTVKITEKCDVYGFGILVLEIVTGRRPVEYMEDDVVILCDMVRGALEEGRVDECIDERMQGKFAAEEVVPVMKLGLICTSQVPSNRPDMAKVINILSLIKCPSESQEESDNII
ncbi:leucine-rich repeat receptor-like protein kinase PXC2 [Bidens hawaiensis]|uniref:leucine-rich repeat receptor-like protein kinase PXC2 n=1 Tax=Bidens hawaiensis TaxID=980011 RepID=UPI004048EB4D